VQRSLTPCGRATVVVTHCGITTRSRTGLLYDASLRCIANWWTLRWCGVAQSTVGTSCRGSKTSSGWLSFDPETFCSLTVLRDIDDAGFRASAACHCPTWITCATKVRSVVQPLLSFHAASRRVGKRHPDRRARSDRDLAKPRHRRSGKGICPGLMPFDAFFHLMGMPGRHDPTPTRSPGAVNSGTGCTTWSTGRLTHPHLTQQG